MADETSGVTFYDLVEQVSPGPYCETDAQA